MVTGKKIGIIVFFMKDDMLNEVEQKYCLEQNLQADLHLWTVQPALLDSTVNVTY